MNAALVFCHSVSPRLQSVISFLSQYYGLGFRVIYDEEKYLESPEACKINYGYHRLSEGEIFIHSHVLLFESSIRPVKIEAFDIRGFKAFFKAEGEIGFDLFAAIFFLLSRYEEYLPHHKDVYGRYSHEDSVAFKENFLHLPLVNIWLEDFRSFLTEKNDAFREPAQEFRFLPTYDIDMAWVYRNKGFKRNAGSLLLLAAKGKFSSFFNRLAVIRKKKKDPYDAYEWMHQLHTHHELHPIYFFLVASERGKYDRNTDPSNPEFTALLKDLSSLNNTGIHPSWASGDHPQLLKTEISRLGSITGKKITASRQHFIRFTLPHTYQQLIAAGIKDEYSMGYGAVNGFRASIASSFYWYDLKNNVATDLHIHPFCFMDANSFYEARSTAVAAGEELDHYVDVTRKVNGTLITIWHNSFLGTSPEFEGWREVYASFITRLMSAKRG